MKYNDIILFGSAEVRANLFDDIAATCVRIQERFDVKPTAIAGIQQVVVDMLHVVATTIESANMMRILVDANKQCVRATCHLQILKVRRPCRSDWSPENSELSLRAQVPSSEIAGNFRRWKARRTENAAEVIVSNSNYQAGKTPLFRPTNEPEEYINQIEWVRGTTRVFRRIHVFEEHTVVESMNCGMVGMPCPGRIRVFESIVTGGTGTQKISFHEKDATSDLPLTVCLSPESSSRAKDFEAPCQEARKSD